MPEEHTEIIIGTQEVIKRALENIAAVKEKIGICGGNNLPGAHTQVKQVMEALMEAKSRGVRIRFITEITRDNTYDCNECMKFCEMRHLAGIKGHFGVSEYGYHAVTVLEEKTIPQLIFSTSKAITEQENYVFETLWEKAIPAKEKIREIADGIEAEFLETIREPKRIQRLGHKLIETAKQEILILFSSANSFHRQEKTGIIDYLIKKARSDKEIKIRILSPMDGKIKQISKTLNRLENMMIREIEPQFQTRISLSVVDKKYCLSAEIRDDTKEMPLEAMGFGFYSNSKATVLSCVSIFETLWTQADLYSRLRDVNNQLQLANEMLQSNDRLQKEFINIAAHELRNPIQPILGLAEVLREEVANNSSQAVRLDAIIMSAKRLQNLQEDILDITRIESNLLKLNLSRLNLEELILAAIRDFEHQKKIGQEKGVIVIYNAHTKDITVAVDRERIFQVLYNLLDNALKFMSRGTIIISADVSQDRKEVVISVKDSGTGIDPEIFPRLFTKFASKSQKGTGLGLYISKGIVEAHGGKTWAENNGKNTSGSAFYFSLPLTK